MKASNRQSASTTQTTASAPKGNLVKGSSAKGAAVGHSVMPQRSFAKKDDPQAEAVKTDVAKAKVKAAQGADEAAPARVGVNIGKTTQMRIMAFQDHTFAVNDQTDKRLTDEELAKLWCAEFPDSRAVKNGRITADMVRAVRRLYNSGTGGHGTAGETHESQPYIMQDGKRVQTKYARARVIGEPKAAAATTDKTPAPTQAPAAATVAKGAGRGTGRKRAVA